MMRKNKLKNMLKNGECAIGTFAKLTDPAAVEILGLSGFDFFVLDNEHVGMSRSDMQSVIRGGDAVGIVPVVRVRENSPVEILQALDAGALGVQVPNVDTFEQATNLVKSSKYSPLGNRGFSPTTRAASYGLFDKMEFIKESNENTLVVAHCETVECINNLDEILTIKEIDVVFIGPMDLSQSMGLIGQGNHPKVLDAVDTIIKKVLEAGKSVGTVSTVADAQSFIERGVQYLLVGSDTGFIGTSAKDIVAKIKIAR
ncbi:HpcH/HpaI aldolase family protein [Alkalibacter mobilis]|uniref:HpcH/HpaI aldolase family protein n=1 Tax=Alkalibacter mobilis TaxID=2787712 RepID=UPI00189EB221|nr:aldolase/citrate lyase family protein [Alkalibacter mobilis]MBF7096749.1 2-dehydro-3-deoxyglucarate aldolase [Alkalibacter mobilis]